MTLVDLLNIALRAYNPLEPHLIEDYYDSETEEEPEDADTQGDDLALFIVRELRSIFEPSDASDVQLCAAVDGIDQGIADLAGVRAALLEALGKLPV